MKLWGDAFQMVRVLRQFSAAYLVAAGLYSCLIVLHARPELAEEVRGLAWDAERQGTELAQATADWVDSETQALKARVTERQTTQIATQRAHALPSAVTAAKPVPLTPPQKVAVANEKPIGLVPIVPKALTLRNFARQFPLLLPKPSVLKPQFAETEVLPARPEPAQTPEAAPPEAPLPSAGEIARVEERLRANLTSELLANFDLFLYVSEAERGPWAQRMYVFDRQPDNDMTLLHAWPVSTGRDARVLTKRGLRVALDTPAGYYQLDPGRFYTHYTSAEWGMPMPYAMFFNWEHDGDQTGLAIHGASGEDLALLGTRASAGCIRLAPENAKTLFNLVREKYKGPVPRFAYDTKTSTMSNEGILWHSRNGDLRLTDGYRVLVFVENYGGENVVAMLY